MHTQGRRVVGKALAIETSHHWNEALQSCFNFYDGSFCSGETVQRWVHVKTRPYSCLPSEICKPVMAMLVPPMNRPVFSSCNGQQEKESPCVRWSQQSCAISPATYGLMYIFCVLLNPAPKTQPPCSVLHKFICSHILLIVWMVNASLYVSDISLKSQAWFIKQAPSFQTEVTYTNRFHSGLHPIPLIWGRIYVDLDPIKSIAHAILSFLSGRNHSSAVEQINFVNITLTDIQKECNPNFHFTDTSHHCFDKYNWNGNSSSGWDDNRHCGRWPRYERCH